MTKQAAAMTDQALIRSFEGLTNKRVMSFLAFAVLGVLALIVAVAAEFRGADVSQGAAALTTQAPAVTQPRPPPAR
jgi:hypothetical protein